MIDKNPHAVELGRLGGKRNTEAKKEAARANGKKGGRPKKELSAQDREDAATEKMLHRRKQVVKGRKLTKAILG